MPVHDWKPVPSGIFHDFHNSWIVAIKNTLNRQLPATYYALSEQYAGGHVPDILTIQHPSPHAPRLNGSTKTLHSTRTSFGVALKTAPPTSPRGFSLRTLDSSHGGSTAIASTRWPAPTAPTKPSPLG